MTGLKDIIESIAEAMKTAGFKPSKEAFSFDAVPDSTIDKAFRTETRVDRSDYQMFMIREIDEIISVWIAYKGLRDINAVRNNAAADRESVERALINDAAIAALDCNPIVEMIGGEMAEYADAYLVSRIDFKFNFVQSVEQ
jgi:hypothetical protein